MKRPTAIVAQVLTTGLFNALTTCPVWLVFPGAPFQVAAGAALISWAANLGAFAKKSLHPQTTGGPPVARPCALTHTVAIVFARLALPADHGQTSQPGENNCNRRWFRHS